jgi:hypothetical protein
MEVQNWNFQQRYLMVTLINSYNNYKDNKDINNTFVNRKKRDEFNYIIF